MVANDAPSEGGLCSKGTIVRDDATDDLAGFTYKSVMASIAL